MKTLKKNNEIKRVKNSSPSDNRIIDDLLKSGWNYCTKSEWKAIRPEKKPTEKENPEKKKVKKRGKN